MPVLEGMLGELLCKTGLGARRHAGGGFAHPGLVAAVAGVRDAGGGDEHVDTTELLDRGVDHGFVVVGAGRVDTHVHGATPLCLHLDDRLGTVLLEDVGDEHVHALVGETEAARAADAVSAPGDDGDLPLEASHGATRSTSGS